MKTLDKNNLEDLLNNNKKQIELLEKILTPLDEGDRFETLEYLLKEGIQLPAKYLEEVYDGTFVAARILSDGNSFIREIADVFHNAGYEIIAERLYYGLTEEVTRENKRD